jgi:DtxR family Mn-dependent transcriptional regulator
VSLPQALDGQAGEDLQLTVRRLGEPLQSDRDLLGRLFAARCTPARRVAARREGATIRVRGEGGTVDLAVPDAQHVFVEAVQ